MKIGQGNKSFSLSLAYLPICIFATIVIASLFSSAFHLGFRLPVISLGLLFFLILGASLITKQLNLATPLGTRLTIVHLSLVCLLGGLAYEKLIPESDLMLWSITLIGTTAIGTLLFDSWITKKIGASGPFSKWLNYLSETTIFVSTFSLLSKLEKLYFFVSATSITVYIFMFFLSVYCNSRTFSSSNHYLYLRGIIVISLVFSLAPKLSSAHSALLIIFISCISLFLGIYFIFKGKI
jgi:hypothetical protein